MNENQSSETIINHFINVCLDVLKKWQFILMVSVIVALTYDSVMTYTFVPQYRCQATFSVKSIEKEGVDNKDSVEAAFSYIIKSNIFKNKMKEAMNVNDLQGSYSASTLGQTNILHVYAISPSAKTSYDMMNALVENYQDISRLVVGTSNIELLDNIQVPDSAYNEVNHKKNIILVSGITFIVIIAIFGVFSFLKNTIKSKDDIKRLLHIKLLGVINKEKKRNKLFNKNKNSILITQISTSFSFIETIKKIRFKLEKYCKENDCKTILITSSLENEGKSTVSSNIALSLGMNNRKVLLIDGDLRKPSLHLIFKDSSEYGINHILSNKKSLMDCIVHNDNYNLDILFGHGELVSNLDFEDFKNIIKEAKQVYDYIIIDSAPIHLVSDTKLMCLCSDVVILNIRQNYSSLSVLEDTIDSISNTKTPIIGGILTYSYSSPHHNKYYGYRYGYGKRKGGE